MNKTVQMITALAERFAVFEREQWKPHWPLKIKIHENIWAAWPDVDRKLLSATLRRYVSRRMYLLAVIAGGSRFDLDGNPAGEIEPSDIEGSRATLAGIDRAREKVSEKAAAERHPVVLSGEDIDRWKAARQERLQQHEAEMSAAIAKWREGRLRAEAARAGPSTPAAGKQSARSTMLATAAAAFKPEPMRAVPKNAEPHPSTASVNKPVRAMSKAELAERARARRAAAR